MAASPILTKRRLILDRSVAQSQASSRRSWLASFGSERERERERPGKERKGWSVTVHDLSGSPVALASMVTPFVASPRTDRVSRSNPGAWLILRPGDGTWKPWGRLEAWRDRGGAASSDALGYCFELLLPDTSMSVAIPLAESSLSAAAFVALAAVVDLSMDACRLFSHKIRKELTPSDSLR